MSDQFDSNHDEMSTKLIIKNRIQIAGQTKPAVCKPDKCLSKSLAKNLNSLSSHLKHNCNLSNSLDRNLNRSLDNSLGNHLNNRHPNASDCHSDYNSNYQFVDNNRLKANRQASHNGSATMAIEKPLCDEYRLTFSGKPNNDNDLDNLSSICKLPRNASKTRQQTKSTSFESSLTDDYNSEHSTDEIGGFSIANADSHSSNLEEDDVSFDKPAAEMEELLDKRSIKDQQIVEVLRQLVRDCTNPDPAKRPSSFQVTERLQPFLQ